MDLDKLLEEARQDQEKLSWEGTFGDYLEMVIKDPGLARLSHARIYDMIMGAGVETNELGERQYKLFLDDLYGLERPLERIVDYFSSAANRLEVRKRILLLLGPPSTGKSTIVNILKKALEEYTRTEEGEVYSIKGCPMQEEPLHLIPDRLRAQFEKEYGVYIEGDLCPHCTYVLRDRYQGKVKEVPVERIVLSERQGVGIGTYVATDPESQDITRLVGSIDSSFVGKDRVETAGKTYRLDGELNVASRGVMDFIEMLKCNELFLTTLVTVTQEQTIKMGRFGTVYVDEAIVAHSNEGDYRAFVENQHTEALQDRIVLVKIPYNLKLSEETRIYRKLLQGTETDKVHFAPLTLNVASTLAILSRLDTSKKSGMSIMDKLALYDGQHVRGFSRKDAIELQDKSTDEGLTGISPRYVVNRLSALSSDPDLKCIDPMTALQALADGLDQHIPIYEQTMEPVDGQQQQPRRSRVTGLTSKEDYLKGLQTIFIEARDGYRELAKKEFRKAFVDSFEHQARNTFNTYVKNITAYVNDDKIIDEGSGQERESDDRFMRQIEDSASIRGHNRDAFRKEALDRLSYLKERGREIDYTSHDILKDGIERRLLPDGREIEQVLHSGRISDEERREKLEQVRKRLVDHFGYCQICSAKLVDYVASDTSDSRELYRGRREPTNRELEPIGQRRGLFSWLLGDR